MPSLKIVIRPSFTCSFLSRQIYTFFFFSLQRNTDPRLLQVHRLWFLLILSTGSPRFAFVTGPSSLLPRTELIKQPRQIQLDWQAAALQASIKPPLKLLMTSWLGTLGISGVTANPQPSKWATSDTTTGLLVSEEGALVISLVASKEGPSWGMVAAGWPREATINRTSSVRRRPLTATPLMALVATLEELFMLEPRRGTSQSSRARKHR